ncbi:MAG: PASTA domain-containing protein, partial [Muribaculaceae bacterium]|nr:PASTA domain-containing protein [Muribaculaceae bacterium]
NMLESRGLNVEIRGAGRVTAQSISPGSPAVRGKKILITLAI